MALLVIEKIIFLNNVPIFTSLRAEDLHLVANITKEQEFVKDEIIFNEGDLGDKMFIVLEGAVDIYKNVDSQNKIKVGVTNKNGYLGEMALFDDAPRSAEARCQTKTRMLVLEKEDLIELIFDYPILALGIIKGLNANLREANQRLIAMKK
jgi:CRP/FNR family transcriptional regulator, cyclic AMP receptor protein